ncbi:ABC transporter permease [Pengzhenrongella sicca]|uniref:Autoinducer 2 import system permease protein LsrD n=1 Tax=Pengzhenrongella sicca TaxID=2819238 RepID=A0A8A4ZAN6_9MICO|nr:ABC transporter permease [Pengzhenrongella sicca]QTE27953.1 ABC transporter permease [Pengzhenrongella sicca]
MSLVRLARQYSWELLLVVLILAAGAWATTLSPFYLEAAQILGSAQYFAIFGILAFGLMTVVIQGEIDISLASTLAVGSVTFAQLATNGFPVVVATVIVLALCATLGAINGVLVAYANLPSLAVTLGTLGAYRGLAYIIGGEAGFTGLPESYTYLGSHLLGIVPASLLVFLLLAAATAVLMAATPFGRYSYAIGNSSPASAMAGVPVKRVRVGAYVVAALTAGIGSLLWIGQYFSARADNADGSILFILTAVVLGGVSIKGGKGTVVGVLLAVLLLGVLSNGMGLANFPGSSQTLILGALLIVSIGLPNGVVRLRSSLSRRQRAATAARLVTDDDARARSPG